MNSWVDVSWLYICISSSKSILSNQKLCTEFPQSMSNFDLNGKTPQLRMNRTLTECDVSDHKLDNELAMLN